MQGILFESGPRAEVSSFRTRAFPHHDSTALPSLTTRIEKSSEQKKRHVHHGSKRDERPLMCFHLETGGSNRGERIRTSDLLNPIQGVASLPVISVIHRFIITSNAKFLQITAQGNERIDDHKYQHTHAPPIQPARQRSAKLPTNVRANGIAK